MPPRSAAKQGPAKKSKAAAKQRTATTTKKVAATSIPELEAIARQSVVLHKHAANTRSSYKSHLERMRVWARGHATPSPSVSVGSGSEGVERDPEFPEAFDGKPKACSGRALALYITFKCFEAGLGKSTSDSSHAAAKKYWEEL